MNIKKFINKTILIDTAVENGRIHRCVGNLINYPKDGEELCVVICDGRKKYGHDDLPGIRGFTVYKSNHLICLISPNQYHQIKQYDGNEHDFIFDGLLQPLKIIEEDGRLEEIFELVRRNRISKKS